MLNSSHIAYLYAERPIARQGSPLARAHLKHGYLPRPLAGKRLRPSETAAAARCAARILDPYPRQERCRDAGNGRGAPLAGAPCSGRAHRAIPSSAIATT